MKSKTATSGALRKFKCDVCRDRGFVKTGTYDIAGEPETEACSLCDAVATGWDKETYNELFRSKNNQN